MCELVFKNRMQRRSLQQVIVFPELKFFFQFWGFKRFLRWEKDFVWVKNEFRDIIYLKINDFGTDI